jgi:hypothetical protein
MNGIIFDFDGPIYAGRKAAFGALDATYNQFEASIGRPRQSMANAPLFPPNQMIGAARVAQEHRCRYGVLCRFLGRLPSAHVDGHVMQASEKPAQYNS